MIEKKKRDLRARYLNIRDSLSLRLVQQFQAGILDNLKLYLADVISKNTVVGLYCPIKSEINILPIVEMFKGTKFAMPVIENAAIHFAPWNHGTKMRTGKFGIPEPDSSKVIVPNFIVIPMLACDLEGYRIGYGKGYYDRYISENLDVIAIGVCYESQIHEDVLPIEDHDQRVDVIITEQKVRVL